MMPEGKIVLSPPISQNMALHVDRPWGSSPPIWQISDVPQIGLVETAKLITPVTPIPVDPQQPPSEGLTLHDSSALFYYKQLDLSSCASE